VRPPLALAPAWGQSSGADGMFPGLRSRSDGFRTLGPRFRSRARRKNPGRPPPSSENSALRRGRVASARARPRPRTRRCARPTQPGGRPSPCRGAVSLPTWASGLRACHVGSIFVWSKGGSLELGLSSKTLIISRRRSRRTARPPAQKTRKQPRSALTPQNNRNRCRRRSPISTHTNAGRKRTGPRPPPPKSTEEVRKRGPQIVRPPGRPPRSPSLPTAPHACGGRAGIPRGKLSDPVRSTGLAARAAARPVLVSPPWIARLLARARSPPVAAASR